MDKVKQQTKSNNNVLDRQLGDEWIHWRGKLNESEKDADSGKRIFLGILLLSIFLIGGLAFLIWYLVAPRLVQFHPLFPKIIAYILILGWSIITFLFLLMIFSIIFSRDLFLHFFGKKLSLASTVPMVQKLGKRFGISRDRIGNSFVKVSNALIQLSTTRIKPEDLIILLPRCLEKSILKRIRTFTDHFNLMTYIVPGGEMARKLILEKKPKAVIGIACERDLVCGIRDLDKKIKVIGIPNKRPDGPCKNTIIYLYDFEKAIQTFLGPEYCLSSLSF